jgi:hypothetical protein
MGIEYSTTGIIDATRLRVSGPESPREREKRSIRMRPCRIAREPMRNLTHCDRMRMPIFADALITCLTFSDQARAPSGVDEEVFSPGLG